MVLLIAGLASLCAVSLSAQEAVLSQEYGSGVHSYFAGNYAKAYEQLTTAIDGGLKDPRAFYFRGLACLNLGRPQDAGLDFRAGAALEADDVNKLYNVGKSLERIQGSARAELEGYRVNARAAAWERERQREKARYQQTSGEREGDLRRHADAAPEVAPPAPGGDDENPNPFAMPGDKVDKPKKSAKKAKPNDENVDPFGGDEEEQPAPATPEKKAGKAGKSDKKAAPKPGKKVGNEPDPFGAKPAEKPGKSDGGKADGKGKKKGSLIGGVGKAIGKAIGGDKKAAPDDKKKPDDSGNN
jgi:hypothetical protein